MFPETDELSQAIEVLQTAPTASMSREEAEQRLLATFAAVAFIADQMRILNGAHLDDEASAEHVRVEQLVSPQQIADSINLMLEHDASLLDDATVARFMQLFGVSQVVDGAYVPIDCEKVQEALQHPRLGPTSTH